MCYNHPAVKFTAKQALAPAKAELSPASTPGEEQSVKKLSAAVANEDASRYCPVCSQRLESRRCKLICSVCGYYMSCADYY